MRVLKRGACGSCWRAGRVGIRSAMIVCELSFRRPSSDNHGCPDIILSKP